MIAAIAIIAEERIKAAITNGEFDDLPGKGKPLAPEDLSGVPEDLRMAYKLLKNSGHLPAEAAQPENVRATTDLFETASAERVRLRQMHKLSLMLAKAGLGGARSDKLEQSPDYFDKVIDRVPVQSQRRPS